MALIVSKFGGSSVSDTESVIRVARRVVQMQREGNRVVVVVSAMGDTTDDLLDMAGAVLDGRQAQPREMDILLTAGERISMALLAMAIDAEGSKARAFTGPQAGLITDDSYGQARIVDIKPERIIESLNEGNVVIVAGFQGFNEASFDTTTLGRGGSDTTAVALASALNADVCEIYTDVDGVFTADPRVVPSARSIASITHEEMLELAAHGAKILHLRAVEFARRHGVKLQVRSSFSDLPGTLVLKKGQRMEQPIVAGLATDRSQAKITVVGVPDVPGAAARLFEEVASAGVAVDMVVQNVSVAGSGKTDISFTVADTDAGMLRPVLEDLSQQLKYERVLFNNSIGILSVVGAGIRATAGVYARVFGALRDAGINIQMISASEIRVSVVMAVDDLDRAAQVVHTAFELDSEDGDAIVYAGTGR